MAKIVNYVLVLCYCLTFMAVVSSQLTGLKIPKQFGGYLRPSSKYCPHCDTSVYSYCSDKLLHDACCCLDPYEQPLPRECRYADCSFLHANSCEEHSLITSCCCTNFYYRT